MRKISRPGSPGFNTLSPARHETTCPKEISVLVSSAVKPSKSSASAMATSSSEMLEGSPAWSEGAVLRDGDSLHETAIGREEECPNRRASATKGDLTRSR